MRDETYADEAANRRILGATRLHCDGYPSGPDGEMHITERAMTWDSQDKGERGDPNESACGRLQRHVREGR